MMRLMRSVSIGFAVCAGAATTAQADHLADCKQRSDRDLQVGACTRLIEDDKLDAKTRVLALVARGLAHSAKRDSDKAIADADQALKLDPESQPAYFLRGAAYHAQGKLDLAIADYDKSIDLRPGVPAARDNRGLAHTAKGDLDRAIADFDRAIQLAPTAASYYDHRANAYRAKGEFDRALTDFDLAIRLAPDYARAYLDRGAVHELKGDMGRAIADYRQVLIMSPSDRLATQRLKRLGVGPGGPVAPPATAAPKPARNPDQADCLSGDRDRSVRGCSGLIESGTLSKDKLAAVHAMRATHQTEFARAIADYDQAILLLEEVAPSSWQLAFYYFTRGGAYRANGEPDKAIADYSQSIRVAPKWDKAYNDRGGIYFLKGDFERALADISQVIAFRPDDPRIAYAYAVRARIHVKMGQATQGVADADRAIELRPNDGGSYLARAELHEALGRNDAAIADFRRALSLNPALTDGQEGLKRLGATP